MGGVPKKGYPQIIHSKIYHCKPSSYIQLLGYPMPLILPHLVGSHAGCLEGEIDLSRLAVDVKTIPITCQKYRWYMILQKKKHPPHTHQ